MNVGGITTIEMGARQYVPILGRFLSVDPIVGGNDNAYNYPNDPVNYNDVNGQRHRKGPTGHPVGPKYEGTPKAPKPLAKGTGYCLSGTAVGFSASLCRVRTLDGKTRTALSLGKEIGPGSLLGIGIGGLWTNARTASDLSQASFGGSAGAAYFVGAYGQQSWNLSNPSIHTTQAGIFFGKGAAAGAGGSYSWL